MRDEARHSHVHIHLKLGPGLAQVLNILRDGLKEISKMAGELERLTAEVAENTEVIASAVTLIEGLAEEIRNNAANPAKLNELADKLDAQSNALAAAVTANTPTPPPVEPPQG